MTIKVPEFVRNSYLMVTWALLLVASPKTLAQECKAPIDANDNSILQNCYKSSQLRFAFEAPLNIDSDLITSGPDFDQSITPAERESKIVFCQYFFHNFSSPGSAKFLCAKTNSDGQLLDKKGRVVPEAAFVSTKEMNLKVEINGIYQEIGEGILLNANKQPIIRGKGEKAKLVEADELKVKYHIEPQQIKESNIKRSDLSLPFDQRTIHLKNVFLGPERIKVPRWTEIFTEVAANRVFWALGIPADRTISMDRLVCFGCEAHPKDQKEFATGKTSVFQRVSLEKKLPGKKLEDQFRLNTLMEVNSPHWGESTLRELEFLALSSRLIEYFNAISLQNRLQCAPNQENSEDSYDKKTRVCKVPVAMIQDTGSSWAGSVSDFEKRQNYNGSTPRGVLKLYAKGRVFQSENSCTLSIPFGSTTTADVRKSRTRLKAVSAEGLALFKKRLENLTPKVVYSIFESAHFDEMEPKVFDEAPGSTPAEKKEFVLTQWSNALQARIDEIKRTECPHQRIEFTQ